MQTITPRSWDRFAGEPGTVLSGARQLTSFARSGAYWFASGQTQQGPRNEASCDQGFSRCAYPEDLYFDGLPLRHVDNIGAVGPGTFFFDYNADRIYFYDDPTNRLVEASVTAQAFTAEAQPTCSFQGWLSRSSRRRLVRQRWGSETAGRSNTRRSS